MDERSWEFTCGDEIVPGVWAWAPLGGGRRCETWLGWCSRRWAAVAVKVPRPGRIDELTLETLDREAARVGGLTHPGIQRLLASRLGEPLPHLVFEYVEGPTLASLLDERGTLPAGDALRLGLQVGAVLHYLHDRGIVHLDVKPDNLVVRDGRVVLLDFDLAREVGAGGGNGRPRGSPPYMAPEQVRCEPVAASMDLFALGVTVYEAVTGWLPFEDRDGDDYPQLHSPPMPISARGVDVPEAMARAVEALLAPDSGSRPATVGEALAILAAALPAGEPAPWPDWVGGRLPGRGPAPPRPPPVP